MNKRTNHSNLARGVRVEKSQQEVRLVFATQTPDDANALLEALHTQLESRTVSLILGRGIPIITYAEPEAGDDQRNTGPTG